jgi:hypothetical protein
VERAPKKEEGSRVSTCDLLIKIPNYKTTAVTAYYDLQSPGTLSPLYMAYIPTPPVDLGLTGSGNNRQPRLTTASGVPVYAREYIYEESLGM